MSTSADGVPARPAWLDWWVPAEFRNSEADLARKATGLAVTVAVGAALCLFGAVRHAEEGALYRAAFLGFGPLPLLGGIWLLRRTRRIELAIHWVCFYATFATLVSVWFAGGMFSIYAGLLVVPVAATAVGGSRVGLFWTAIVSTLIAFIASRLAETPTDEIVGWNALVGVAIVGTTMAITEAARERAARRSLQALATAASSDRILTRTERALADSQELFRNAFDKAPSILVLSVAETGELVDVNERFVELVGYEREEVLGRDLVELGVWGSRANRDRVIDPVMMGDLSEAEIPLTRRDGSELWLLASAEILEIDGRRCLLCQGVDITDRRRADEALEQARRELESRVEERGEQLRVSREQLRESERLAAVGTLAAGVAHQINNPIGGIAAASEYALMLDEDEGAVQAQREALETALEEARRCGRIVKSMLKFARDEPTPKWVEDMNATVRRAAELGRSYVEGLGGKLEVEIWPSDLPALISPIDVDQMIVNLVRNAAESKEGGALVKVATERIGEVIEVSVTDDGRGIDDAERSRVYDPFFTTRLEEGGSGLGLSVVHGVVADHGATLDIESPPPCGTRFVVRFPIAES